MQVNQVFSFPTDLMDGVWSDAAKRTSRSTWDSNPKPHHRFLNRSDTRYHCASRPVYIKCKYREEQFCTLYTHDIHSSATVEDQTKFKPFYFSPWLTEVLPQPNLASNALLLFKIPFRFKIIISSYSINRVYCSSSPGS